MKIKYRLGETDAAKYPQGDQWFAYDSDRMQDMGARELIALEKHLDGHSIIGLESDFRRRSVLGLLGVMYLARRLAGVNERWENFDPQVMEVEWATFEGVEDDPDPTDGSETDESPTPS